MSSPSINRSIRSASLASVALLFTVAIVSTSANAATLAPLFG